MLKAIQINVDEQKKIGVEFINGPKLHNYNHAIKGVVTVFSGRKDMMNIEKNI